MRDRILIIESDVLISDFLGRQALTPAGYQTHVVSDVTAAISKAIQLSADVIIADLTLPGLSGKDLMVALASQNIDTPVIVLGRKDGEADIIQAFRLGASDYLLWPVRETEVINVVERVLKQVHERRERERLAQQLQQINQELQQRVRELTTIFSIGKAVTSVTDQSLLFDKILEGALGVTQADMGWFLLRSDDQKSFLRVAQRNLPASIANGRNQPWDDSISSLVAMSGEALSVHGDPLKRFKIASLGNSALIVPIKVQKQVIGLLNVMRKRDLPFSVSDQHLLEAMADYASISLVNARLFRAVEEKASTLQRRSDAAVMVGKIAYDLLAEVKKEMQPPLQASIQSLDLLLNEADERWSGEEQQALLSIQSGLQRLNQIRANLSQTDIKQAIRGRETVDLVELARQAVDRSQNIAEHNQVTLVFYAPQEQLLAQIDCFQIQQVLEGLLSNAIKYSKDGGQVLIQVEKAERQARITVSDEGDGVDEANASNIFKPGKQLQSQEERSFGGLGISLSLVKEVVQHHRGKLWVEGEPGKGARFLFTLPLVK
jgi:signal transduction histidine kinase/DNA-binding response OmpR family regulator